jgi:hypothetical protein
MLVRKSGVAVLQRSSKLDWRTRRKEDPHLAGTARLQVEDDTAVLLTLDYPYLLWSTQPIVAIRLTITERYKPLAHPLSDMTP